MKIVYARNSVTVAHAGQRIGIRAGEPWDGDDPLVTAHADLFTDGPAYVRSTREPSGILTVPAGKPAEDKPAPQRRRPGGKAKAGE